ncbi:MAG: hypothetical protein A3J76_05305 [Candidatus Moranbacteria bacterium RBG_13_45_13]|nr:MAG: hypothetical protein A3J76_05305 [Candidatus Moranbacteria bacterium RBG_13_45_13]
MAIYQSGTAFFQKKEIRDVYKKNKNIFPFVCVSLVDVPTYLIGNIALALASKKIDPVKISPGKMRQKYNKLKLKTKYYNPEIHFASFVLPNNIKKILGSL